MFQKSSFHKILCAVLIGVLLHPELFAEEKNLKAKSKPLTSDKNRTLKVTKVPIKESVVEIQGKTFRRIEYNKDFFYLELMDSSHANDTYRLLCQRGGHEEDLKPQVKVGVKTTERSMFIIQGLKQYCSETTTGRKEVAVDSRVAPGFQWNFEDENTLGKKDNVLLKNKKIIVTPVDGVVFKADW